MKRKRVMAPRVRDVAALTAAAIIVQAFVRGQQSRARLAWHVAAASFIWHLAS